jgi:predicted dehydrogenase
MRRIRVGVLGLGVGERHLEGFAAHPIAEVAAVCDFDPDRLREVVARHPGIRAVARAEDVLDDPEIDAVSIATWDNFHYEQIERAVRNGKHVFVEKPLVLRPEEGRQVARLLAERPNLKISSNLILRLSPRFLDLRDRVRRGEFGDLFALEGDYEYGRLHKIVLGWRGRIPYYSVFLGGAIHLIDLLLWISGEEPLEACAAGNRIASRDTGFRFDDYAVGLVRCVSGAILRIGANFGCVRPHFHALRLFGTRGTFENRPEGGLLYRSRDPEVPPERIDLPAGSPEKWRLAWDFVDAVANGREPAVSRGEIFRAMALGFALEASKTKKEWVPVERFGS